MCLEFFIEAFWTLSLSPCIYLEYNLYSVLYLQHFIFSIVLFGLFYPYIFPMHVALVFLASMCTETHTPEEEAEN